MAANMVLLEKITVGAATAASVTFNNIPQTGYTDLKIVASARHTGSVAQTYLMKFNGATTSYSERSLEGTGSAVSSFSNVTSGASIYIGTIEGTNYTANTFNNTEIYIPNYTSANYKSVSVDNVTENNATAAYSELVAGLWSNTAAITSVNFTVGGSNNFTQYSTFSLYGLAAVGATPAIDPKATGGDIIQTDGTYWYHAFLSSGTFTPKVGLTCDVLVVAGGGGGGASLSSGAGAGGVQYATAQSLTASTSNTVTIGANGGGAAHGTYSNGNQGSDSVFGSIITAKGGAAGISGASASTGIAGGSGSGGAGNGGSGTGGAATAGTGGTFYGNAGGNASGATGGAGGGGASSAGAGCSGNSGGAGGSASNLWSSWLSATGLGVSGYIAGGGGGGCNNGGSPAAGGGGGATGGTSGASDCTDAIANTGSGGGGGGNVNGGGGQTGKGGNGGSGLVIVRYTVA